MKKRIRRNPRGIMFGDLMIGLAMAFALLMAMTAALSQLNRGERQLAESRLASRQLEEALWTLQTGGKPAAGISIERLEAKGVDGRVWVRVSMAPPGGRGPRPTLTGLVPAPNAAGGAGGAS
jgi:hypothetical protein